MEPRLATEQQADSILTLDLSEKFCPVPIVELAKALRQLAVGCQVELLATDPGVESDLAAWCRSTGNELLRAAWEGGRYRALVRRTKRREEPGR